MTTDTTAEPRRDIHTSFGLSYANYLVLPRTLLQSMPEDWQHQFVALVDGLHAAFRHVEQAECYDVIAGRQREIGELTDAERQALGITRVFEVDPDSGLGVDDVDAPGRYIYLYRDEEHEGWERIVQPAEDPVPPYNRGRTRVEPLLEG